MAETLTIVDNSRAEVCLLSLHEPVRAVRNAQIVESPLQVVAWVPVKVARFIACPKASG